MQMRVFTFQRLELFVLLSVFVDAKRAEQRPGRGPAVRGSRTGDGSSAGGAQHVATSGQWPQSAGQPAESTAAGPARLLGLRVRSFAARPRTSRRSLRRAVLVRHGGNSLHRRTSAAPLQGKQRKPSNEPTCPTRMLAKPVKRKLNII